MNSAVASSEQIPAEHGIRVLGCCLSAVGLVSKNDHMAPIKKSRRRFQQKGPSIHHFYRSSLRSLAHLHAKNVHLAKTNSDVTVEAGETLPLMTRFAMRTIWRLQLQCGTKHDHNSCLERLNLSVWVWMWRAATSGCTWATRIYIHWGQRGAEGELRSTGWGSQQARGDACGLIFIFDG